MQIHIQSHGFVLTDALREHAERRLHFGLSHGSDQIRRVEVHLDSPSE